MSKRRKNKIVNRHTSIVNPQMSGITAGNYYSPARPLCSWLSTDPRVDYAFPDMLNIWRKTRAMYYNFPQVAKVVDDIVTERGILMPHPATTDEQWNRLARDSFLARFSDASRCEASGRLNWKQMQLWLELHALLDGDCLTVFRRAEDGGLMVQLYAGPQIRPTAADLSSDSPGCITDSLGRVTAFQVFDWVTQSAVAVSANHAHLYLHDPDPVRVRGISPLVRVVDGARDLLDIIAFNKTGIKAASSIAFWEYKPVGDPNATVSLAQAANSGRSHSTDPQKSSYTVNGSAIASPLPGRELRSMQVNNPSQQVHEFMGDLRDDIASGAGTDPERVFLTSRLNSASARLNLAKGKRATDYKLVDRMAWANAVYRRHILMELASGRLPACNDSNPFAIRWVPDVDPTIDKGREGALMIKLIGAGLEDADAYTLATTGMTVEEIAAKRIHTLSHIMQDLPEGVTLQMVMPEYFAQAGAAPVDTSGTSAPSTTATPLPDSDPE